MKHFWAFFFSFWAVVAIVVCWISPDMGWWFYSESFNPLGRKIDDLFYLILWITGTVYIGTQIALCWTLWKSANDDGSKPVWFSHGSHNLEVIWTIVPAGILLFIALYQMDVWAEYSVKSNIPEDNEVIAEVTARQFEWRIRYPKPGTELQNEPQPGDLYTVNDLHVPTNKSVTIKLKTEDVQHSFFVPAFRVKKDAVPNLIIPIWWEVTKPGSYDWTCTELCGWGHYKMKARVVAESDADFRAYLRNLAAEQNDDGTGPEAGAGSEDESRIASRP